ncbi:hypothetical protein CBR_g37681 [Chara braunii]|uniref:Uncharacterized protein n=1 Tax=Chara braunii TaxID=69332 RepID=A0A388JZU2_CHABU|nr:hypothetical protein CBR_g37681 [Chara braunii]|eukprot:GBG63324.1 hypothetical protein CBR_g37681 [Chara braunii]
MTSVHRADVVLRTDFREEGTWFDVTQHEPVKGHASKKKEQLQVGTYRDRLKEEGKGAAKGVLVGELEGHDVKLGWGGGREVHHHHHHHGLKHKGTEEDVSAGKEAATVTNAKQDRRDMEERHDSNDEDKDERRNDAGDADGDGDGGEEEEEEAEEKTKKKAMVGLQGADDVDDERNDDMGIRIRKHRQEEKEKQAKMEKKKRRRGAKSRREKW